jgi:hypothetical protein
MAADFELYLAGQGSCQVWKLFKQGTLVGHFYLENVQTTFKQDSMTMRDQYDRPLGVVDYNAHHKIILTGTMYPDPANATPAYDIRQYFKLLMPTARPETLDVPNIDE